MVEVMVKRKDVRANTDAQRVRIDGRDG